MRIITKRIIAGIISGAALAFVKVITNISKNTEQNDSPEERDEQKPESYAEDVTFYCPNCNAVMDRLYDDLLDLECPKCGETAVIDWDDVNHEYYANDLGGEYSYDDIFSDPEENMPYCCRSCGCGAYPDCITSCRIFDDD